MKTLVALLACVLSSAALGVACREEAAPTSAVESQHTAAQLYSCSMHPHVLQKEPGACPICGMDLTRVGGATAEQAPAATTRPAATEGKVKYWVAPMDPAFVSDKPGKSPMGMDLVPVYEAGAQAGGPGTISIDPVVVQNMGVRVERVARQPLFRHIRTVGEVTVAEDEISVVNLRFAGWVEKIHADKTGDPVEKGETLFEIYSPELVAAQEEYLLTLRRQGPKSELAKSSRRKLELWDLSAADIDEIARSGRVRRAMPVRAPRAGFILEKRIVEGAHVREGTDLYRLGDLSRIWVTAEVYEYDAPWVEAGQPAQMELTHEPGRVIEGSVAYVYPTLDRASRTLRVRLEFENPGYRLKPGMFATVYIQFRKKEDVLAIPTEAIIHSGTRQIVFVSSGDGRFEPREITTGLVGDRHMTEVLSGLEEGEHVVASGQFLIDSESQLQEAIQKMLGPGGTAFAHEASTTAQAEEAVWACPTREGPLPRLRNGPREASCHGPGTTPRS
ncbi:MAG: efflux RND transporter periplasmic adaptor subunit [Deltaproteobacteria bacterium]|nr:efflux RND transporter periplasmic adaptor subunit [Deltaproteobacteria bacterium]